MAVKTDMEFDLEVLKRLPLANAVWKLSQWSMDESFLQALWDRHRGRCYDKVITLPVMVSLIADALMEHQGSGRRSFQKGQQQDQLETSLQSAYDKLGRLPVPLSEALLLQTTQRLKEVLSLGSQHDFPNSLEAFSLLAFDGKTLKHVPKRLKSLRKLQAGVLGAKSLAVLNLRTGLVESLRCDLDGEASELSLLSDALTDVREYVPGDRLFVWDRLYCDLTQPHRCLEGNDHFLIRYNAKTSFTPDASVPVHTHVNDKGERIEEEWGWLGKADDSRRLYVRRITLRPTGQSPVIVVTDLLDSDMYPVEDLLEVYRRRWGIEEVFQQITEVFSLKHLIGGRPRAMVFQLSLCMILYNLIQVIQGYVACGQQRNRKTISSENLFSDVHRQLISLHELVGVPTIVTLLEPSRSAAMLRRELKRLLGNQWSDLWRKSPSNGNRPQPERTERIPGNHTSVHRVLTQNYNDQEQIVEET